MARPVFNIKHCSLFKIQFISSKKKKNSAITLGCSLFQWFFYTATLIFCHSSLANGRCENTAATLESVEGVVEWSVTDDHWQQAARGDAFCYGDKIRILEQRAALRLANDTVVRLRENSVVTLTPEDKGFWIELVQGAGHFLSRTPKQLTIKAAYLNAAIDGTEFVVAVEEQRNRVAVFEGDVRVFNRYGEVRLGEGTETSATAITAPDPARSIRLRDAAEWILHYPPLIIQNQIDATISALMDQERYADALNQLDRQTMTSEETTLAASLALISGQPSMADRLLNLALQQNPQSPEARALQALKALTAGNDQAALSQTSALLQTDPDNISVLLAHAYALQSQGKIEEALKTNRQALSFVPDNLFILARTAELELSSGNTRAARKLIDRALQKAPNHSRVNTLAGFIALNRFANKEAQTYFRTAINSNDSEPLARLGLALALIQKGKIEQGRAEMEMAVLLDPGSSLLRSYLGKTYAALDQNDWADTQYQLAKNLDPNDPTPWFYEGLQKQQQGELIEAVNSFQKSHELNNKRAVYRSRSYLNTDAASRTAAVGSIYDILGMSPAAIHLGARAIQEAPAESNGHKLLAEAYAEDNRYESLKISERLQSTMLQPLGSFALPFALSQPGLLVSDGAAPGDLGVNEYGRLFVENGLQMKSAGLWGTQNTRAYDARVHALRGNFSIDAGQYIYETNGFRENNQIEYRISGILARWQPLSTVNVQTEVIDHQEEKGDLSFRFDLENYDSESRSKTSAQTYRAGLTVQTGNSGTLMASFSTKNSELLSTTNDISSFDELKDIRVTDVSYVLHYQPLRIVTGGSISTLRLKTHDLSIDPNPTPENEDYNERQDFDEYYIYATALFDQISLSFGMDFYKDHFKIIADGYDVSATGERLQLKKIGVSWRPTNQIEISASEYESASRIMELQTTLKPTHFQHFPQIFDGSSNGTIYDNFSASAIFTPSKSFSLGITKTDRDLLEQVLTPGGSSSITYDPNKEKQLGSFITWNPGSGILITVRSSKESTTRPFVPEIPNIFQPLEVATTRHQLQFHYFKSKYAWSATINDIEQKYSTEIFTIAEHYAAQQRDDFFLVDFSLKYRFSQNDGSVSARLNNAFDKKFRYADYNTYTLQQRSPQFLPERSFLVNLTLNFD